MARRVVEIVEVKGKVEETVERLAAKLMGKLLGTEKVSEESV